MFNISNQFFVIHFHFNFATYQALIYVFNMHIKTSVENDLIYIIKFSFCIKCCTYEWENVNLNTEIHCHFTYCIAILHITLQIEFCYTYASIEHVSREETELLMHEQIGRLILIHSITIHYDM